MRKSSSEPEDEKRNGATRFQPLFLEPRINIDALVTVHYFAYAKNFQFRGEKHDFWELAYVDNGEAGVMADNNGYVLSQGEAIFHKPDEYHRIWANGRFTNVVIVTFISRSADMKFFRQKIMALAETEKKLLALLVREAQLSFAESLDIVDQPGYTIRDSAPYAAAQMLKLLLEQLLISLIRNNTGVKRDQRLSDDSRVKHEQLVVEQILDYMAENLHKNITLDEICDQVLFSRSYVKAVFKKLTGDSVIHHFTVMKIAAARRLISEKKYTFSEIADMLGFCSVHHFSRTFSRITRLSPREYARSIQSKGLL